MTNYPTKRQQVTESAPLHYQGWLTGALLALLLCDPLLEDSHLGTLVLVVLGNVVVIASLYAVSWNNRRLAVGLLLAIPSVITTWSFVFRPSFGIAISLSCSIILFFGYTLVTILQRLFRRKRVGLDELFGALNVYILLGVSWGLLFSLVEAFSPGAFELKGLPRNPSTFIYYSFSTLGTLGLGDVHPVLPFARSLSIVEMLFGLFFVAVTFGKLVAVFRFDSVVRRKQNVEKQPFERSVRLFSALPQWSFVLIVTTANLLTSIANDRLQMPLFLDTWATSAGIMLGGLAIGLMGGVLYNLLMAVLFWGPNTWVWSFNTALVALLTRFFWKRGMIDINRPFTLVLSGLVIAITNALLGILIVNLAGLPRNASTMNLHNEIFERTGSLFAADFMQQAIMESMDKTVSLVIAAIVVYAINELRSMHRTPLEAETS